MDMKKYWTQLAAIECPDILTDDLTEVEIRNAVLATEQPVDITSGYFLSHLNKPIDITSDYSLSHLDELVAADVYWPLFHLLSSSFSAKLVATLVQMCHRYGSARSFAACIPYLPLITDSRVATLLVAFSLPLRISNLVPEKHLKFLKYRRCLFSPMALVWGHLIEPSILLDAVEKYYYPRLDAGGWRWLLDTGILSISQIQVTKLAALHVIDQNTLHLFVLLGADLNQTLGQPVNCSKLGISYGAATTLRSMLCNPETLYLLYERELSSS